MTRRMPPSAEALTEALRRYRAESGSPAERLIPVESAERVIVEAYRTNFATARRWIEAARTARALYLVRSGVYGHLSVLAPRTDGKPGLWWTTPSDVGFGAHAADRGITVTHAGLWTAERVTEAPERTWVATPDVLAYFAQRAQWVLDASRVEYAAEQVLTDATIRHMHADAVDVIRGLIDAVGLHTEPGRADLGRGWTTFDARVHERRRTGEEYDQAAVHLTLYGEDIDLLGEALRRLGIRPKAAE